MKLIYMADQNGRKKDSELQSAAGPADPELESLIAPQGYAADFVDDIATMETPAQQRRQGIRFVLTLIILLALGFWFCTPSDFIAPENIDVPAPYGLDERPVVPTNIFLKDVFPQTVAGLTLVDVTEEKAYEDPYIGADIVRATYVNDEGIPAVVVMSTAGSYINARRYLENYKTLIETRATPLEWQERLHIEDNYIQWAAPGFADQSYGLAWNNEGHFISITSPIREVQEALATDFPY